MRRRAKLWLGLLTSVAVSASSILLLAGNASASGYPQISVTPSEGLRDGQQVMVSGSDLGANASVTLRQCGDSLDDCESGTAVHATTDASGALASTPFIVHVLMGRDDTDCVHEACNIIVTSPSGQANQYLQFGPQLEARGDRGGYLHDGDRATVTGRYFDPNSVVTLSECTVEQIPTCNDSATWQATADAAGTLPASTFIVRDQVGTDDPVSCAHYLLCVVRATAPGDLVAIQYLPIAFPFAVATPSSRDLRDGAVLTIYGIEFDRTATASIVECASGYVPRCDPSTVVQVTTDTQGGFTAHFRVKRVLSLDGAPHDCGGTDTSACLLRITTSESRSYALVIGFDVPAFTVSPSNDLTDGQDVELRGYGFQPGVTLSLSQCADPSLTSDSAWHCDPNTEVLATTDQSGLFGPVSLAAHAMISPEGTPVDCSRRSIGYCAILARAGAQTIATQTISFATSSTDPVIALTPSIGVHDGDEISVNAGRFAPNTAVELLQCSTEPLADANPPYPCDTDNAKSATTDQNGSLSSVPFTVHQAITTNDSGRAVDCADAACNIVAVSTDQMAVARVDFRPPTLTVSPHTNLLDGQTVVIQGSGLRPLARYWVAECGPDPSVCDEENDFSIGTDANGNLGPRSVPVAAVLHFTGTIGEGSWNCRTHACRFAAYASGYITRDASTSLSFAPIPPAPKNVHAGLTGDGEITITYTAAQVTPPITKYEATCSAPGEADHVAEDAVAPFEAIRITGLTRRTTYSCTLRALNETAAGPASTPQTVTVPDVPDAPPNVTATPTGYGQVTVSYGSANDWGAPITQYDAMCHATGPPKRGTDSTAPFEAITIGGLTPGVTYSCTVRASNAVGAGVKSSAVSIRVPFPPGAPTNVRASVVTDRTVTVSYQAPPDDGGSPIQRYEATCRAPGQPDRTAIDNAAPFDPIAVSDLARSTTYACTVRAWNAAGASPESAPASVYVPAPPTARPTNVVAVPLGFGRVRVSYTPITPAGNGGAPVLSYQAICRAPGQPDRIGEDATEPFGPITVSGLTSGVVYNCVVRAVNIAGPGPESASASVAAA